MYETTVGEEIRMFWALASELRDAKLNSAAAAIWELRDDLEVLAMHSEFPRIRRACAGVLSAA